MVSASAILVLVAATFCTASANSRPQMHGHMQEHAGLSVNAPVRGRRVKPVGAAGVEHKNPNVERMASGITTHKVASHSAADIAFDNGGNDAPEVTWKVAQVAPRSLTPTASTEDESSLPSWTFLFSVVGVAGFVYLATKQNAQGLKGGKFGSDIKAALVSQAMAVLGAPRSPYDAPPTDEKCDFGLPDEVHMPEARNVQDADFYGQDTCAEPMGSCAETMESSPVDEMDMGTSPEEPQPEEHLLDSLGLVEPEEVGL